MFGKRIPVFKLFGFEVKIDMSWFVLAILISWSLAKGFFPHYYENLTSVAYWWMGIVGALILFFSIVFHELSHSLVARKYGLEMKGITLFIFGGVAEMEKEPESARSELLMAIAGPASSIFLAVMFYALHTVSIVYGAGTALVGVLHYAYWVNAILAIFNLLPAFPLDGGRVLRAFLWGRWNNLQKATRVAGRIGSGFGFALIALGVLQILMGNFIGGIWWGLIGLFMRNASQSSMQHVVTKSAFEGEKVRRFMKTDPITVPRAISVEELVENYIYKYHFKMYPVVDGERLVGCVTTREIKSLPRDQWGRQTAGALAKRCSEENAIGPDSEALEALSSMSSSGNSRLMVVENERLVGVIALKDLLNFLALKLDLEGNGQ